jgi:hypothetical protein
MINQQILKAILAVTIIGAFILYLGSSSQGSKPTKSQQTEAEITALSMVINNFKTDLGTLPSTEAKLFYEQISGKNKLHQNYLENIHFKLSPTGTIIDPWGYSYRMMESNGEVSIISPGLEQHNRMPWYIRDLDQ